MTREEAIIQLDYLKDFKTPDQVKALEMAIQALSQEPTDDATLKDIFCTGCEYKEQEPICDRDCEHCTWTECPIEPCDDAISREAVYRLVDDIIDNLCENSIDLGALESWGREQVMNIPSVTPKPTECDDAISREAMWKVVHQCEENNFPSWVWREMLSQLPSVTQKPIECDDAISRKEILKYAEVLRDDNKTGYKAVKTKYIRNLPSVTQKSKTGHWIERKNVTCLDNVRWKYECSECGYEVREKHDYCVCGADMRGAE